jgi:hypothetical protein
MIYCIRYFDLAQQQKYPIFSANVEEKIEGRDIVSAFVRWENGYAKA